MRTILMALVSTCEIKHCNHKMSATWNDADIRQRKLCKLLPFGFRLLAPRWDSTKTAVLMMDVWVSMENQSIHANIYTYFGGWAIEPDYPQDWVIFNRNSHALRAALEQLVDDLAL